MRIYDDRYPSFRKSSNKRRFDALMEKYMRKSVFANSEDYDRTINGDVNVINILAYRDRLNRKGQI